jgi:hypothetical protein
MPNFDRKRHLQPRTYTYYNLPCSKRDKAFTTLSPYDQWKANRGRDEHPELDTHLHSVMLVATELVQRFNEIAPTLEQMFQSLDTANRSLHAAKLQSTAELRDVMFYGSKLLKEPISLLKDSGKVPCDSTPFDLYTVLHKSKREPVYRKLAYERKLLEDHAFRKRHQRGRLIPELESEYLKGTRLIPNLDRKGQYDGRK